METSNKKSSNSKNFIRILIAISVLLPSITFSASFDCNKAVSKIEKLICSDDYLSALDTEMSELYFSDLNEITDDIQKQHFKNNQKKWLKEKVNRCSTIECLTEEYSVKISNLKYSKAVKLFKQNEPVKAKAIFIEAANKDIAAVRFLMRNYDQTDAEYIDCVIQSIILGDKRIIENELDNLFYRAGRLNTSNPARAYKLLSTLKKLNMTSKVYREAEKFSTLSKCYETADFDPIRFAKTYNLDLDTGSWQLAEEASKTNRFGNPDPELILALVCRGGFVPMELELAVDSAYSMWKQNKVLEFDPCDYAVSNISMNYCSTKN